MVRSNDRALVIKPARPRPGTAPALQVCQRRQREGAELVFYTSSLSPTQCFYSGNRPISFIQHTQTSNACFVSGTGEIILDTTKGLVWV